MIETIHANLYDYPGYYDLVYGSDWKAEFDFLQDCFGRHARRRVRRVFEPACGTGRLLVKLAAAGYEVSGLDLNAAAVEYCNRRLSRRGFSPSAVVGDMAHFRLHGKVDVAFNMINSFRHLIDPREAESHLRCIAAALVKGGLYVLGLHLLPTVGQRLESESWSARRGHLAVISRLWTIHLDPRKRRERLGMTLDIYMPTRSFRLVDEMVFRTYTVAQFRRLLGRVQELEVVETYDFTYRIDQPHKLRGDSEDVVFVLRRR